MSPLEQALALCGGTHAMEDVLAQIERGDAQAWHEGESVIVTEVHLTPRKKLLHFWLAAGELDEVVRLSHRALAWGKGMGCEMATLAGRRGWEKVLATEGWEPKLTLMRREIEHG